MSGCLLSLHSIQPSPASSYTPSYQPAASASPIPRPGPERRAGPSKGRRVFEGGAWRVATSVPGGSEGVLGDLAGMDRVATGCQLLICAAAAVEQGCWGNRLALRGVSLPNDGWRISMNVDDYSKRLDSCGCEPVSRRPSILQSSMRVPPASCPHAANSSMYLHSASTLSSETALYRDARMPVRETEGSASARLTPNFRDSPPTDL